MSVRAGVASTAQVSTIDQLLPAKLSPYHIAFGEADYNAAHTAGRAMSLEQAVAYALEILQE